MNGSERTYDLIVIGTGNAGTVMSLEARREGWKVAIGMNYLLEGHVLSKDASLRRFW
jgi:pyruvate/2-oxoglutarate dehydrogenase complex dihydrolipoamide dehydrogenase (E3) component